MRNLIETIETKYANSKIIISTYATTFKKKSIVCQILKPKSLPITLNTDLDNNEFKSKNQAINQAKEIINFLTD